MKFEDFLIGNEFYTASGKWRCTDLGTRVIVAIHLSYKDESWFEGPPYAVVEHVFNEYDFAGCVHTLYEANRLFGPKFAIRLTGRKQPPTDPELLDDSEVSKPHWLKFHAFPLIGPRSFGIQLTRWARSPFIHFSWKMRRHQNHPGIEICITLFWVELRLALVDCRHWDRKTNRLF